MSAPASLPWWLVRLPRRRLSRFVGRAARLELPRWLLRPLLGLYARFYGVRREEMARPLGSYASFVDFFTRTLVPGARPLPADATAIASPADGRIAQAGRVEAGTLIQAKGMPYGVDELVAEAGAARTFEGGTYHVVYLAPGDYHRFHWPFDATIESVRHVTGELWPVNAGAVAAVPRLFAVNERVVVTGRVGKDGLGGRYAFVAVGALDVGSIRLAFQDIETNVAVHDHLPGLALDCSPPQHLAAERGAELGLFELGSTVIVVLAPDAGTLDVLPAGQVVRVGEAVGRTSQGHPKPADVASPS
ncbi:MAG: archaetidylserine decarboxylase [Planctomycetota bacterium]